MVIETEQKLKTKNLFHTRYLTALFGLVALIGVAFPWFIRGGFSIFKGPKATGLIYGYETPVGLFNAIATIAIIAISLFQKTLPLRSSSPIASIIACLTMVFSFVWMYIFVIPFENIGEGFGWSMFFLGFSFLSGLIINQGVGTIDWSTYLSLVVMGLITLAIFLLGFVFGEWDVIFPFACCPGLIILQGIVTIIRGYKRVRTRS